MALSSEYTILDFSKDINWLFFYVCQREDCGILAVKLPRKMRINLAFIYGEIEDREHF